eukprot:TRINITY_DN4576_c4_g1_i1.p1 TRINITY_DN4576_c4_g1~~TRINITY_DN4576_c4_g1_i1.p1  ORF type:complete len:189 (+),score=76.95 TRINITY_DN4576_c4_g1_i1:56-622(+)
MSFFGLKVKPGVAYDVQIPKGKRLHLTAACMDVMKQDGGVSIAVTIEEKEHIIAMLHKGHPMVTLDLLFGHGQKVAFNIKEGDKVTHLTGYFEMDTELYFTEGAAMDEFGEESDDEDDGDWADADEDDNEEAIKKAMQELSSTPPPAKPAKKQKSGGKRTKAEAEAEAESAPPADETPKKKKKKKSKK